jgi:ABC-type sugar transport system ATPase subunit
MTTVANPGENLADLPAGPRVSATASALPAARREQVMLTVRGSVNFDLRAGEVLGLAGIASCERAAVLRRLFGVQHPQLRVTSSAARHITSPREALRAGIVLVPSESAAEGPFLDPQGKYIALPSLSRLILESQTSIAKPFQRRFGARSAGQIASHPVGTWQPLVLSKWLANRASVLLLDEPTRSLDIEAKLRLRRMVWKQAAIGNAIVVSSSDAEELSILCHRALVLRHGAICGELARANISEANISRLST